MGRTSTDIDPKQYIAPSQLSTSQQKKTKHIIICFDGTSNDEKDHLDADRDTTNVPRIAQGIEIDDSQDVIYVRGIGNDQDSPNYLMRKLRQFTGLGGKKREKYATEQAFEKIQLDPNEYDYEFSLLGFSRGSSMARDWVISEFPKLLEKVGKLENKSDCNLRVDGVYLFDCVYSYGFPIDLWLLKKFGISLKDLNPFGHEAKLPDGIIVEHLVSKDERRSSFAQTMVACKKGFSSNTYHPGDHADVGGGHRDSTRKASDNTLINMAKKMQHNGVRFTTEFVVQHHLNSDKPLPLGKIHKSEYPYLPPTQKSDREPKPGNGAPGGLPTLNESLIRRMIHNRDYDPKGVKELAEFMVETPDLRKVKMSHAELTKLLQHDPHRNTIAKRTKDFLSLLKKKSLFVPGYRQACLENACRQPPPPPLVRASTLDHIPSRKSPSFT